MTYTSTVLADESTGDARQQILILYLANSSLSSEVVGWSFFDGASRDDAHTGDSPDAPFATGVDALRAGWLLLSASPLLPPPLGAEYSTSVQKFEFIFQRLIPIEVQATGEVSR
jgi:hypothetical protein